MRVLNHWLRTTTWRRVSLYWEGGSFTAEAYEYPDLSEASRTWVAGGHGETPEQALEQLGERLNVILDLHIV